ncbi:hypothetical protein ACV331_35005, partial [Pseudomonas aeruginosa]
AEQQLQARHESIQRSEAGELAADEDCASLAGFIGFAWQGALARFKVGAGLARLLQTVLEDSRGSLQDRLDLGR